MVSPIWTAPCHSKGMRLGQDARHARAANLPVEDPHRLATLEAPDHAARVVGIDLSSNRFFGGIASNCSSCSSA
jgi:hypothetical protein